VSESTVAFLKSFKIFKALYTASLVWAVNKDVVLTLALKLTANNEIKTKTASFILLIFFCIMNN
jgi:hypothetical protein